MKTSKLIGCVGVVSGALVLASSVSAEIVKDDAGHHSTLLRVTHGIAAEHSPYSVDSGLAGGYRWGHKQSSSDREQIITPSSSSRSTSSGGYKWASQHNLGQASETSLAGQSRNRWRADSEQSRNRWRADSEQSRNRWRADSEQSRNRWRADSEQSRNRWRSEAQQTRNRWGR